MGDIKRKHSCFADDPGHFETDSMVERITTAVLIVLIFNIYSVFGFGLSGHGVRIREDSICQAHQFPEAIVPMVVFLRSFDRGLTRSRKSQDESLSIY